MNQNNIKPQELLTGKAKEHYHKCLEKNGFPLIIWSLDDDYIEKDYPLIYALIIDWLDSVGIYIETFVLSQDREIGFCFNISGNEIFEDGMWHNDRHHATQEAIKKAVEIYNKGA